MSETRALQAEKKSEALHKTALALFPGGVNSPVRAFRAVGGNPRVITAARGAYLTDADGNELLDYVLGWGPMLLGHGRPEVVNAVALADGRCEFLAVAPFAGEDCAAGRPQPQAERARVIDAQQLALPYCLPP